MLCEVYGKATLGPVQGADSTARAASRHTAVALVRSPEQVRHPTGRKWCGHQWEKHGETI